MNGFKSRKFILAFIVVVSGVMAAFVLPAWTPFAWLKEHTVAILTIISSLTTAYIGGNAILDWFHKNDKSA
jgi:hypothetical protein